MYQVISSSSKGNAVLYHDSILVDCGVSFASILPHLNALKIILLTHEHSDHFKEATLKKIFFTRPGLRIVCGAWLAEKALRITKNVDIIEIGKLYDYGTFQISAIKLYHDVPNCGYRIFKDGTKILHATDTATLDGIEAKGYDLYALEHNYNEETIFDTINQKRRNGEFSHELGSINSHLSEQQAQDFVFKNGTVKSKFIRLHQSSKI